MRDTRHIIAEQAQRRIVGGNVTDDSEVTTDELVIYVDQAFGQLIYNNYFENKMDGESNVNGSFIYSFVEDVKCDEVRDKYYVTLPSSYVNLPNNIGLYSVSTTQDEFNTYLPLTNNFLGLARGLEVNNLEGLKAYYVENTRLWLHNVEPDELPNKLLIKLAGGIQAELDPDVDIPLNMQAQLVDLTVQAYLMQQQVEKDINSDNIK